MGKNNKPILSVLVDAEKKEQFADLARQHKQSMGWLLNDCIDRMLAANSIGIYSNSAGNIENTLKSDKSGITALDVEEIVKTYVSNHSDKNSIGMTRENIESIIKSYVDTDKLNDVVSARINEVIDKQVRPLIERSVAEELLKVQTDTKVLEEMVKANIAPIVGRLTELENQFATVKAEEKQATSDGSLSEEDGNFKRKASTPYKAKKEQARTSGEPNAPNMKSWEKFFKMVGVDAMTAVEAQKKQDTDTRAKQIESGIQAAKDQGLGEWTVKVAGRSFVRVDTKPESTLTLFPE